MKKNRWQINRRPRRGCFPRWGAIVFCLLLLQLFESLPIQVPGSSRGYQRPCNANVGSTVRIKFIKCYFENKATRK
uniref:Putative secreted peptide n=1 Tax=Anopheles braziliensis TaxID=58242 RepID=A0A2M3ZUK8_9DIPT